MIYSLEQIRAIPIIFIVGKGRSGTTLLSTILDSHPNVASATESRFLLLVWQRYKGLKKWDASSADEYLQTVKRDYHIELFWEFEEGLLENLKQLPAEAKVQDLIKLTYIYKKSMFPKEEIKFIVDKNPRYTLFIHKLNRIFPEAKFIRIVRDPRDNVASSIKYNNRKAIGIAYKWKKYNQYFDGFEKGNENAATFSFEDLIKDKAAYFERFEQFTNLSNLLAYEQARLAKKDEFERILNEPLKEQHGHTVKPLDKKKVGHFQSKLKPIQIRNIEAIVFPYATKFKYEKTTEKHALGLKRMLRLSLHYQYKFIGNQIVYNLPYTWMMKAKNYIFNNLQKNKKKKYESLLKEHGS